MTLLDQIENFEKNTGYKILNSLKSTLEKTNGLEGEWISKIEKFKNCVLFPEIGPFENRIRQTRHECFSMNY